MLRTLALKTEALEMSNNFTESDWKAFRRFKDGMLETLMVKVNREASDILNSSDSTATQKYYQLFDHIQASDSVVADCFNGWKRSNMTIFASNLLSNDLLPDELWDSLSEPAKVVLREVQKIRQL